MKPFNLWTNEQCLQLTSEDKFATFKLKNKFSPLQTSKICSKRYYVALHATQKGLYEEKEEETRKM
jgi:hypothetical protein